jgi:hypothetical protein
MNAMIRWSGGRAWQLCLRLIFALLRTGPARANDHHDRDRDRGEKYHHMHLSADGKLLGCGGLLSVAFVCLLAQSTRRVRKSRAR